MKPHRMRMTHNLLTNYGVLEDMDVFVSRRDRSGRWSSWSRRPFLLTARSTSPLPQRPTRSTHEQLTRFHVRPLTGRPSRGRGSD
jgi:hypothetical protein